MSNNTGILNACTRLWLTESEQAIPVDSKFRVRFRVRQTPEEGQRTYRPKRCGNNNKNEDNSPKTLNDENHQASSHKFRQLIIIIIIIDCSKLAQKKYVLNSGLKVSAFDLQLRYYVHFRNNTVGKYMNPLSIPKLFYEDDFSIKLHTKVDMPLNKEP